MTEPGSSDLSEDQRLDSPDVLLAHIRELRQKWPEPEETSLSHPAGKVSALWGVMYRFGWSVSPPPEMSTRSQFFRLWMGDTSEGRAFRAEQWRQFHDALSIAEDEARKHQGKKPTVPDPPINLDDQQTAKKLDQIVGYAEKHFGYKPSTRSIQKWRENGSLRIYKRGTLWVFSKSDLDTLVRKE